MDLDQTDVLEIAPCIDDIWDCLSAVNWMRTMRGIEETVTYEVYTSSV